LPSLGFTLLTFKGYHVNHPKKLDFER